MMKVDAQTVEEEEIPKTFYDVVVALNKRAREAKEKGQEFEVTALAKGVVKDLMGKNEHG